MKSISGNDHPRDSGDRAGHFVAVVMTTIVVIQNAAGFRLWVIVFMYLVVSVISEFTHIYSICTQVKSLAGTQVN